MPSAQVLAKHPDLRPFELRKSLGQSRAQKGELERFRLFLESSEDRHLVLDCLEYLVVVMIACDRYVWLMCYEGLTYWFAS